MPKINYKCPHCGTMNECGDLIPPSKEKCKKCGKIMTKNEKPDIRNDDLGL